ncbi:MAG: signal peptidase II [Pseudomonadota bacterium]
MFNNPLITASLNKWPWFAITIVVLILDQTTKSAAVEHLIERQIQGFLPYFNFTLLYNEGAAFSLFSDAGGWQRWFLGIIAAVVSVILVIWICRLERSQKLELSGLAFILGGALGNLWDRIYLGKVVDFVDWFYPSSNGCLPFFYQRTDLQSCHWPVFNIADSAILLGVFLLIIDMFLHKKEKGTS